MKFLPADLKMRTRRLNRRRFKSERRYVLCWLQQALRAVDNPIVDVAIAIGNERDLPVVVYHGLDNRYPHASHRFHRFILEASQSLEAGLAKRRLRFCRYVRRPDAIESGLVYRLAADATCIVTDDMPTYVANWQATSVASKTDVPVFVVDAACAVPMNCFPKLLPTTKAFRSAHSKLRSSYVEADTEQKPAVRKFTGKLCFPHDDVGKHTTRRLDTLIKKCGVDLTVPPAKAYSGRRKVAMDRLQHSIMNVVNRYKWTRNNPALPDSTTQLSPYLRFGVIGPKEIVRAVKLADIHSAARYKFFDELLTWREYFHHLARHAKIPSSYQNVPTWAKKTLQQHKDDERQKIYSLSELVHAQTDDKTWNAAQRQFVLDGWMHNNLRMYWVKQIIKWRPDAEDAWRIACYLNDRFSLDGRDPATYGNMRWGFGLSKRGYREIDVYGWVPPKSDRAVLRRDGVPEWIEAMNARKMIQVDVDEKALMRLGKRA